MAERKRPPSTFVLTTRGDIKSLANALRFYNTNEYYPRTRGELSAAMLKDFGSIVEKQLDEPITTVEEAMSVLENAGFGSMHRGGQGAREYLRQLSVEKGEMFAEPAEDDRLAEAQRLLDGMGDGPDGLEEL